jgi:hypothetical protein
MLSGEKIGNKRLAQRFAVVLMITPHLRLRKTVSITDSYRGDNHAQRLTLLSVQMKVVPIEQRRQRARNCGTYQRS